MWRFVARKRIAIPSGDKEKLEKKYIYIYWNDMGDNVVWSVFSGAYRTAVLT